MDNFFITNAFPEWRSPSLSTRVKRVNALLEKLGFWPRLGPPPEFNLTSIEQRMNMYHLVSQTLAYDVPGDLVELGCHSGQSSVLIRNVMDQFDSGRELHVYDSFQGLPAQHKKDAGAEIRQGMLAVTAAKLIANFEKRGLVLPHIHKGWFEDTLPTELPASISFAYLDGDFYSSLKTSLEHVYPRMSRGAVCLVDDCCDPKVHPEAWNKLPGVKKACDEYLADKPETMVFLYSGYYPHAFFRKL